MISISQFGFGEGERVGAVAHRLDQRVPRLLQPGVPSSTTDVGAVLREDRGAHLCVARCSFRQE
jgi:hypothetical protein